MSGALDGVRVIELALMQVGPHAATLLGDMGAEVIKIADKKQGGDPMRGVRRSGGGIDCRHPSGRNYMFESTNRNKRSITLDLKKEEGRKLLYQLVEKSDVFLTNFRRDVCQRLGADYDALSGHNPRLIYACANGFGAEGPDSHVPSQDMVGQARSGIQMLSLTEENGAPWSPNGLADEITAIMTAYGVMGALVARERTGIGQQVDTSQLGSMMLLQILSLDIAVATGKQFRRIPREEAVNPTYNTYCCADGKWLALGMFNRADHYWPQFCRAIDREEWIDDPRYCRTEAREEHSPALVAMLEEIFGQRPRAEWIQILKDYDVVAAVVNHQLDLPDDPQVIANEYIIDYDHPVMGKVKRLGFPVKFHDTPCQMRLPAPELGEHTETILQEVLGYSWDDIANLKEAEVI